jgi:hypothetical protein
MPPNKSSLFEQVKKWVKEMVPIAYVWQPSKLQLDERSGDAVGIIIQPGPGSGLSGVVNLLTLFMTNAEQFANLWGHTAIYTRIDGVINKAIGFDPHRLRMFNVLGHTSKMVQSGKGPTPGYNYCEEDMFNSPDVICIEIPLESVSDIQGNLSQQVLGPLEGFEGMGIVQYVTRGGKEFEGEFNPQIMGNCIDKIQTLLGDGWVLTAGGDCTSSQGKVTKASLKGEVTLAPLADQRVGLSCTTFMPAWLQLTRRLGGLNRSFGTLSSLSLAVSRLPGMGWLKPKTTYSDMSLLAALVSGLLIETLPEDYLKSKRVLRLIRLLTNGIGQILIINSLLKGGLKNNRFAYFLYIGVGLGATLISHIMARPLRRPSRGLPEITEQ